MSAKLKHKTESTKYFSKKTLGIKNTQTKNTETPIKKKRSNSHDFTSTDIQVPKTNYRSKFHDSISSAKAIEIYFDQAGTPNQKKAIETILKNSTRAKTKIPTNLAIDFFSYKISKFLQIRKTSTRSTKPKPNLKRIDLSRFKRLFFLRQQNIPKHKIN